MHRSNEKIQEQQLKYILGLWPQTATTTQLKK